MAIFVEKENIIWRAAQLTRDIGEWKAGDWAMYTTNRDDRLYRLMTQQDFADESFTILPEDTEEKTDG